MGKGVGRDVKSCLNKAIDSAMLAVETYNKPATKFKSGGFIVLMCIAWTSLLHAIFIKEKIKPCYKVGKRYKRVEGEIQYWELKECVRRCDKLSAPVKKNIEFFIPLRNKIEHKFMPEIDSSIFAECQALLMNFDTLVEKEFGESFCLKESLSFSLQLFPSTKTLEMSASMGKDAVKVTKFIESYRAALDPGIIQSGQYSFKAYLIQVANHKSKDALPVQFVNFSSLTAEEQGSLSAFVAMTKEKHILVANKGTLKPGTVVKKVQEALGNPKIFRGRKEVNKFNLNTHTAFCKKYNVWPSDRNRFPEQTKSQYCIYDEPNASYLYTEAWVDFLVKQMQVPGEYESLFKSSPSII